MMDQGPPKAEAKGSSLVRWRKALSAARKEEIQTV